MGRDRSFTFLAISVTVLMCLRCAEVESAFVVDIDRPKDQGQTNDTQDNVGEIDEKVNVIEDAQTESGLKINAMIAQEALDKKARQIQLNELSAAQAIAHEAMLARFEALEASGRAKIEALQIAQKEATKRALKQLADLEELLVQNKELSVKLTKFMNLRATGGSEIKVTTSGSGAILQSDITGGASYTRWGRSICSGDATVVYDGYAATSMYNTVGGGTNFLCMHKDPLLSENITSVNKDWIRGVEYNFLNVPFITGENYNRTLMKGDMPCAICQIPTRSHQLMIPGLDNCPSGWTIEYSGYLVSSLVAQQKSDYTCLDKSPETVENGEPDAVSSYVYPVEAVCGGSLPCPPYISGYGIPCVVCSK